MQTSSPTSKSFNWKLWYQKADSTAALDYYALGVVVFLGILRLAEPLWGDQALFVVGAKIINNGGLLYRDFWDLKPPGIYGFYALAGRLFGFTSAGVHLLELIWMMTLAIVLRVTLAPYFKRLWLAKIIPWLCVGSYYAIIDSRQQMQVESLMGLPIYLSLWCTLRATQQPAKRWRWLMASGIFGGIVLLFKLIYLPLLMALWSVYLIHAVMKQRRSLLPTLGQTSWPLAIGTLLPIIPVLMYWHSHGMLGEVFYYLVQYPTEVVRTNAPRPLGALIKTFAWFGVKFFPLITLAAFGGWWSLRRRQLLGAQLLVWLTLGLAMITAQSQSWWTYHLMLLLVPLTILAALGIDGLIGSARQPEVWLFRYRRGLKVLLAGCLGWLLLVTGMRVGITANNIARSTIPLTAEMQVQYQRQAAPLYNAAVTELEFLNAPDRPEGSLYVFGNPVLYLLANKDQPIPMQGWISEILLPEQWKTLVEQLDRARPRYIYIMTEDAKYIAPNVTTWLGQHYQRQQESKFGTWYQLSPA
ncbi:MAG: hypothetical protein RLZZ511_2047 [Cyanobacteriota bacterium]|jgi:hypothetical protein